MAGQGTAPQFAAANASLGSPKITSPHLTNVMIAAATVAAAQAAHDVGLGPPPSLDPTAAAAAATMAVMGSPSLPAVTSPHLATATVQAGTPSVVPAGVATVPMGSPDGTTAPKTIGMMGMTAAKYELLKSVASANALSSLIAAQSMEEGELKLELSRVASLTAAAAAAAATTTVATSPVAPPTRLQLPLTSTEGSKPAAAVCEALVSPFATHDSKVRADQSPGLHTTRHPTAKQLADGPKDRTASGSGQARHGSRPNSASVAPSRLGPGGSSRPPTAAGASSKATAGGSRVTAFKIANPSKQLVQKMSAAAAATFERGVSPEEAVDVREDSRHNSPAPGSEAAPAAAAALGTTLTASQQPSDSQQQQHHHHQQQRRSSSPDVVKSKHCSSNSGRRSRSRSSTRGRSRSVDSKSPSPTRSSFRSSSRDKRYYSKRRRSSSRGDRYYSSRTSGRGAHSRSRSRDRSYSPRDWRYGRKYSSWKSGNRYESSRQHRERSRSRERYRHRYYSRSRSRSRSRDRVRQRDYYSKPSRRSRSYSRSKSPVRSRSRGKTPEPAAAARQRQSRTSNEVQARGERSVQEQHKRVQAKAAAAGSTDDGDGAAAGRATSTADRLARTISSSSTDKQRQQQLERTSSRRDSSRDREADTTRDSRARSKQQQTTASQRSSRDGAGVRIGNFSNPSYCPHPPPSDPNVKYWRGRDGYVHDRQGNKWDPKTKVLLEAAPSSAASQGTEQAGRAAAAAAAGPRSVTTGSRGTKVSSPTEHSSKRQRRDLGVADDRQQQQQRQPDKQEQRSAGASAAAMPSATAAAAGSHQGLVRGVMSNVLPEELDVDMEIEEAHEPPQHQAAAHQTPPLAVAVGQSKTVAGVARGTEHSQQHQQKRSRPFGSAARRPPALQVTATTGAAGSPAADKTRAAAAAGGGGGGVSGGGRTPTASMPPASPPPALSPSVVSGSSMRASLVEAGHCNMEYQNVALEALQHNLSTLDTTSFKSSTTLELEASTLKSAAAKLAGSHGWDVRALLLQLSSGMKYLEWAHSFAGSGGVGVASISKQQAYKNNLTEAANTVRSCAKLGKQQIVARAIQLKAAGRPHQAMTAMDYAFAAVRLLADKLDAVASMNLLFVKTQGFNTTMRNLTQNTSPTAVAAVTTAAAVDGPPSSAGGAAAAGPGSMAAPAARAPAAGGGGGGVNRGRGGAGGGFGPSPGESGTQNSASSAVEFVAAAAEGSRATDRVDLADAVQEYITLTEQWTAVAEANEAYLHKTGRAAAAAEAAEAATEAKSGRSATSSSGSEAICAAALSAAHRVGQLILAVGFEAGLWDLPAVLDIARQAADAIMNMVETYGNASAVVGGPQQGMPGAGAAGGAGGVDGGGKPTGSAGGGGGGLHQGVGSSNGLGSGGGGHGGVDLDGNAVKTAVLLTSAGLGAVDGIEGARTPVWSAVETAA